MGVSALGFSTFWYRSIYTTQQITENTPKASPSTSNKHKNKEKEKKKCRKASEVEKKEKSMKEKVTKN